MLGSILLLAIQGIGPASIAAPPAAAVTPEAEGTVNSHAPQEVEISAESTAHPDPTATLESILAPTLPPAEPTEPFVPTVPAVTLASPLPGDRGSMATVGGLGLPAPEPTEAEMAKLEMARRAVQQAIASGIYSTPACADEQPTPAPAEIEAAKLQRLRATPPVVLPPDKAAGVDADPPPLRESGPTTLSEQERAKLDALPAATPEVQKTEGR